MVGGVHSPAKGRRRHTSWCALLALALAACATAVAADQGDESLIAPLAAHSLLLDAAYAGERMVVVGERGHILLSDDGGETWRQVAVPSRTMLTAVSFADERRGWAVGHDATILATRDGGETWVVQFRAPQQQRPFLDVWFADAMHGVAVGAYGLFMRTRDGGETWIGGELSEDDYHLNQLRPSDSGRLYVAAEAGRVYRSDDAAESWRELPSPYEGSLFGVLPLDGDVVLAFGLRGRLFRSDDAGERWVRVRTGSDATLTAGLRARDGSVIVMGLAGTLLLSRDEGRSFELRPYADRMGLSAALQRDDGALIRVGQGGVKTDLGCCAREGAPAPGTP